MSDLSDRDSQWRAAGAIRGRLDPGGKNARQEVREYTCRDCGATEVAPMSGPLPRFCKRCRQKWGQGWNR